jgi:hypothetical protein
LIYGVVWRRTRIGRNFCCGSGDFAIVGPVYGHGAADDICFWIRVGHVLEDEGCIAYRKSRIVEVLGAAARQSEKLGRVPQFTMQLFLLTKHLGRDRSKSPRCIL